ncbi:MAG: 2-dehydropantoate 2-reductase [Lachnospiraceae bacterium]|nr:2-dehydropantoate 2-reductase [Lachnospiraceae bacterium]
MKRIESVNIIGLGALGLLFGKEIMDRCGVGAVTYTMDAARYEKYRGQTFTCNDEAVPLQMVKAEEASVADLVIVAVKYTELEAAIQTMRNCVGPDTIIISVLNGISSEEILAQAYGADKIIYTVAQGMDAMKFGNALRYTRQGQLHIGMTHQAKEENFLALKEFFDRAGVPYIAEEDILYRMWSKFMLNVGVNQTCMVYDTNYAGTLREGEPNRTMISAMREVIALANAEGIALSEKDLNQYMDIIKTLKPEGTPSMGQDRINRKPSEVELFAGTVIRMAKPHGLYVPTNEFLYKRVQEIEQEYQVNTDN